MKKRKIGIVTIHTDFNYGAVLQAVATQKYLRLCEYDAEIINYENPIIGEQSRIIYKQDGKISGYIKTAIRNTVFGRYFYYRKAIKDLNKYRILSDKKYNSIDELDNSAYDILVAGSDQIWNPCISRGLDPVFMLNFGNAEKRISIASSMGSYELSDADKESFKKYLSRFNSIGVREEFARKQLQPLVNNPIKVLCDPTLLLQRDIWWNELAVHSKYATIKEKYIVTYFVGSNKSKYKSAVAEYSKSLGLPVWTIQYSNYTWKESDKKILGASIADFIALIANAQLVITDSFHGVAFSLNMGVDFVALTNSANPVRVLELLNKVGESNRIDMKASDYCGTDKLKISAQLDSIRRDSSDWIINAINN